MNINIDYIVEQQLRHTISTNLLAVVQSQLLPCQPELPVKHRLLLTTS